jgi:hypothetical protein
MKNAAHQKHLEYLWNGELEGYDKFIFLGSDARQRELFGGGVYFLWNQSGLQYIGQSEWIWNRLTTGHSVIGGDLGTWVVGVIPAGNKRDRLRLEAYCIRKFNPPLNVVLPNADKASEIARLRQEGKTLQAIGNIFNITRERVRQILAQD